jgi:hypothetical protein
MRAARQRSAACASTRSLTPGPSGRCSMSAVRDSGPRTAPRGGGRVGRDRLAVPARGLVRPVPILPVGGPYVRAHSEYPVFRTVHPSGSTAGGRLGFTSKWGFSGSPTSVARSSPYGERPWWPACWPSSSPARRFRRSWPPLRPPRPQTGCRLGAPSLSSRPRRQVVPPRRVRPLFSAAPAPRPRSRRGSRAAADRQRSGSCSPSRRTPWSSRRRWCSGASRFPRRSTWRPSSSGGGVARPAFRPSRSRLRTSRRSEELGPFGNGPRGNAAPRVRPARLQPAAPVRRRPSRRRPRRRAPGSAQARGRAGRPRSR